MEEHEDKDVCVGNFTDSTVVVREHVAGESESETLVESMASVGQAQIEGSFTEGVGEEDGGSCNGEDVMVEVVGSDVFVDGVCTSDGGVRGDSIDNAARGQGGSVGLEKDLRSVNGEGAVVDNLGSREIGVSGGEAPSNLGIETGVEGSLVVEEFVVVTEEGLEGADVVKGVESERGVIGGDGSDVIDGKNPREVAIMNDEAQNGGIETGVEGSLMVADTMGGETQVTHMEEGTVVARDEGLEEVLVKEGAERDREMVGSVESVDGKSQVLPVEEAAAMESEDSLGRELVEEGAELGRETDGGGDVLQVLETQNIGVSDDEEGNPEGYSAIVEDSSIQTQVVEEEAARIINEEGLNPKDDTPGSESMEENISIQERDQISVVESVDGGIERDGVVNANPESLDEQAQVTEGGEIAEGVPCSKVEGVESDAFDGNLSCTVEEQTAKVEAVGEVGGEVAAIDEKVHPTSEEDQQLTHEECLDQGTARDLSQVDSNIEQEMDVDKQVTDAEQIGSHGEQKMEVEQLVNVENVSGSTESCSNICADSTNSCQSSQAVVRDEVAAVDYKVLSNPTFEVPNYVDFDGMLSCSENAQNSEAETGCTATVIDTQVTEGGKEIDLLHNQEALNASVDVLEPAEKDQQLKLEECLDKSAVCDSAHVDSKIKDKMEVQEQFNSHGGHELEVQELSVKVESDFGVPNYVDFDGMYSEDAQNSKAETVCIATVIDAQVTEGGKEIALMHNQEALNASVDVLDPPEKDQPLKLQECLEKSAVCDIAHDDSKIRDQMEVQEQVSAAEQVNSHGGQELEVQDQSVVEQSVVLETVSASTENHSDVCADPVSLHQPTLITIERDGVEGEAVDDMVLSMEVPHSIDLDGVLTCSGNDQNLKTETLCGSMELDSRVTDGGEITLMVNEEVLDSKVEVLGPAEADKHLESEECIDKSNGRDLSEVDSNIEQVMQVEERFIDDEQVDLHVGQEIEVEEQDSDSEQPKTSEEIFFKRTALKPGSSEKVDQASYWLPPEVEGELSVSDLVWGKVRSHPWWPGQIFDPSDASEKAMKYQKKDCFLVAYFGDRTFAWNEASLLKPFRTHFSQIEKQSNSEAFQNAVNCALKEVSRRVKLGLACSCMPEDAYDEIKFQFVENTGIREESSMRDGVDKSASANSFEPDKLVEYMKALAQSPFGGGDRLELVIAKAQLLGFYRSKGYSRLPKFQFCGGLLENDADTSQLEDKIQSDEVIDHATLVYEDFEQNSPKSSHHKRKHNLKDTMYPSKKERSLSELMGGAIDSPDGESGSDEKATSKLVSPSSGKKRRAVDSVVDDSVMQEGRKTISLAKVSITTPHFPKPSFKIGECIRRVASQMTGPPSILKCNNERFQKLDGSNDRPAGDGTDVYFENSEDGQKKRMIFPSEYSSLDDLLSQLQLAARDPLKGYSFLNIIISFFSDFRNSIILDRYSVDKAGGKRKKLSNSIVGFPETFEFEDMSDTYWTDRIIQNGSEEQPSSKNRKDDYQLALVESEKPLQRSRRSYSRKRYSDGNHNLAAEKPPGYVDERSPAELIMNFPEVDCVPSETNLNKMFRRFGPLKESETEVDRETNRARVVFKRCSDAEVAFSSAGKFNIFGPTLVNYQLSYSISDPFKAPPIAMTLGEEEIDLMLHS